jgi:hypothetical protein
VAAIAALPGEASVLLSTDGEERAAHDPDAVLAVGSAAKLAILKALDEAVAAGRLAWDQVVDLDPAWRSLPTGILQDWPDTPLTIATLANLMISISDNTATDAVIHIVGREPIEAISPRNTPFLTTAELFKLKANGNEAARSEWLAGDENARRAVLRRIADLSLPRADALQGATLGIEWFMSATEICALLEDVAHLPAMRINPGLADAAEWKSVAFKGLGNRRAQLFDPPGGGRRDHALRGRHLEQRSGARRREAQRTLPGHSKRASHRRGLIPFRAGPGPATSRC